MANKLQRSLGGCEHRRSRNDRISEIEAYRRFNVLRVAGIGRGIIKAVVELNSHTLQTHSDPLPMISAVLLPGVVCPVVGVEGAINSFAVRHNLVWTFAPKSLSRFLNTRLSLSELGGKGDDFPNIILAGCAADAEDAEIKVDVELPAVDGDAEAKADNEGDDAVVLVLGLNRG